MNRILLVSKTSVPGELDRAARLLGAANPNADVGVVCPAPPEALWARRYLGVYHPRERIPAAVATWPYSKAYLVGFGREELLSDPYLRDILTKDAVSLERIDASGRVEVYAPFVGRPAKTLLVFPGPITPLTMGAHQRAFALVMHLNRVGVHTDVLITGGGEQLPRLRRALLACAPRVHTYKNNRRKRPRLMRARGWLESRYRCYVWRVDRPAPYLFSERLANKATYSSQKTLVHLLSTLGYENVIVSYGWMEHVRELVPPDLRYRVRWFCDTHDVQFVRSRTNNRGEHRLGVSHLYEKHVELRTLAGFDKVIAISRADERELKRHLPADRVLRAGSDFTYAFQKIVARPPERRICFGFIGSKMDANVKALLTILKQWWPTIRAMSPKSKLVVAGTVGSSPAVEDATFLDKSVEVLGMVPAISEFLARVDVLLNPVLVKGGLNFKAAEALVAGKLVITNPMGIDCLEDPRLALVCSTNDDLCRAVKRIIDDPDVELELRRKAQSQALKLYGPESAYDSLCRELRNG